jgi:IKI3 family
LYQGSSLLSQNVTSTCLRHSVTAALDSAPSQSKACDTPPYLLFTTRDNMLHAVPLLAHPRATCHVAFGSASAQDERPNGNTSLGATSQQGQAFAAATRSATRAVEAGARLVACPAGTSLVILQMPRGNLEGACLPS